jgi:hypothetical protein
MYFGVEVLILGYFEVLWNVVARDGIEPPTPAFSGLAYRHRKAVWNQRKLLIKRGLENGI